LDTMMNQIEVISIEQKGKNHAFDIKLLSGSIERFYFSYNAETFVPEEMVIYYADQQKIFAPGNKQYIGKPILKVKNWNKILLKKGEKISPNTCSC